MLLAVGQEKEGLGANRVKGIHVHCVHRFPLRPTPRFLDRRRNSWCRQDPLLPYNRTTSSLLVCSVQSSTVRNHSEIQRSTETETGTSRETALPRGFWGSKVTGGRSLSGRGRGTFHMKSTAGVPRG